ncbi:MAG: septum formation initiator family protein [Candidatus Moranbacteria bacterium]|nr:septum formation initiator family protein [Candidatus Moranbacteria bacterium]
MQSQKWMMRIFLLFALGVTAWAGFVSWGQLERHKRITDEVNALEKQAKDIALENQTLEERISYFSTREFREQEARQKLGLKKPEETVVAIKEDGEEENPKSDNQSNNQLIETKEEQPNFQKWWALFFSKN